jgi:hypothetical protein
MIQVCSHSTICWNSVSKLRTELEVRSVQLPNDPPTSTDSNAPQDLPTPKRRKVKRKRPAKGIVGWREWLQLPGLGVDRIKVKVDTGARSSCLHAFNVEVVQEMDRKVVHFDVHPVQSSTAGTVRASAELVEYRSVRSSSGHCELRPVIRTLVTFGEITWPIEVTLTNRDQMGFRMLLGRRAIASRFTVDPAKSYVQSAKLNG